MQGLAPGEYRVFAIESCDADFEPDPELLQGIQEQGRKVEVRERGHESVTLKPFVIEFH